MPKTPPTQDAALLNRQALSAYNASDFEQAIEHSRAALVALEGLDDPETQRLIDKAFERLAMTYQRIGDFAAAREVIDQWQQRTNREEGYIQVLIQLSRVESYTGNYEEAARLAEEATERADKHEYPWGIAMSRRVRADLMWKMGYVEQALTFAQQALAIFEQVGDLEQQAATHVAIAASHHFAGQFFKSIQHLQRALRIVEHLGRRFEMAIVYSNLGETYAELYAMDKALDAHQKAVELVGFERAHPDLIRNLGVDLISVGRQDEGCKYLAMALERAQSINDPDLVAQVLFSLAEVDLGNGDLIQAERHGQELQQIAIRLDSLRHRIRALMILGEFARQQGDHVTAQAHFNDSSMMVQRSADRHSIWQTHAALHDLLRESMPQMADIHRRIAAEMMTHILTGIDDDALRQAFRRAEPVQSVLGPLT